MEPPAVRSIPTLLTRVQIENVRVLQHRSLALDRFLIGGIDPSCVDDLNPATDFDACTSGVCKGMSGSAWVKCSQNLLLLPYLTLL